jgi:hypothetical protein
MATLIFLAILKTAVAERGAMETRQWQEQAAWLAESGLERAAARLAADPGYRGETWTIPAAELGGQDGAVVRIEVEPDAEQPERRRRVSVQADYPDDPRHRARRSKEIAVRLGSDMRE